uniref:Regulatory protein zeste n=1 Tax=Timema monikensis TaxID=170555 RepID=A0A7R9HUR3_9NEOP|nr:unnamed protein product [Timema monikensis]
MASTSKVVRGEKASPGQISTLVDYMLNHREVAAGRLFGIKGRENLGARWQELGLLLNTMGPHKSVVQWQKVWTDLKYKARRHAALLRADHLKTGNKLKNEPALNDMEKKILTIIGPETAEGYCVADSLPERQEDLLKALDGIPVPSVEDDPPQLFLKELLEGPVEVVEQECENPDYEEAGISPKQQRLRKDIEKSREQFAELQAGQTEVLKMMAETISKQSEAIKDLSVAMTSLAESVKNIVEAINKN